MVLVHVVSFNGSDFLKQWTNVRACPELVQDAIGCCELIASDLGLFK